jgi:hypothetical protein
VRFRPSVIRRSSIVQLVVLGLSGAGVAGLWFVWHSHELDRPDSSFARSIAIGIGRAPSDTRVFLNFDPWNTYRRPTLEIVLGQSEVGPKRKVPFRFEFEGFLTAPAQDRCEGTRTANTCWDGDGTVSEAESQRLPETVIKGTFVTTGFTRIETSPLLGDAKNGPYRSLYEEIRPLSATDSLRYPTRGVEAEITTDVGSTGARYESFFPVRPYRLYPDGWAWLLPAPGGPIGMQVTDTDLEQRLRRRSEIAGLFMGVLLALFVQVAYDLTRSWASRGAGA